MASEMRWERPRVDSVNPATGRKRRLGNKSASWATDQRLKAKVSGPNAHQRLKARREQRR